MKLWRTIGRKGLRDEQGNLTDKGQRYASAHTGIAFRRDPGMAIQVANLLTRAAGNITRAAHEYIRIPSLSKAAVQNTERKRALAGRFILPEEHKAYADWKGRAHTVRLAQQAEARVKAEA
ncbi:hypothetical protein D3C85_1161020 [compost metagenome]